MGVDVGTRLVLGCLQLAISSLTTYPGLLAHVTLVTNLRGAHPVPRAPLLRQAVGVASHRPRLLSRAHLLHRLTYSCTHLRGISQRPRREVVRPPQCPHRGWESSTKPQTWSLCQKSPDKCLPPTNPSPVAHSWCGGGWKPQFPVLKGPQILVVWIIGTRDGQGRKSVILLLWWFL